MKLKEKNKDIELVKKDLNEVKCYKVVRTNKEYDLQSAMIFDDSISVKYRLNEYVKANIGGLFCFDTVNNASLFASLFPDCIVYSAIGKNQMTEINYCARLLDSAHIELFWKSLKDITANPNMSYKDLINMPTGTILFEEVKLVRRIL